MIINLQGVINNLSYGLVTQNIIKELIKNHQVNLYPISPNIECSVLSQQEVSKCIINTKKTSCDLSAPSLRIWHQFDLAPSIGRGPRIGYSFFELDSLNEFEIKQISSLDLFLVPSKWAKTIVENQSKVNCEILNPGVDTNIFYPIPKLIEEKTIFLNIGKWEVRKGHDFLLQAFNKAFDKDDNVELWLCPNNPVNKDEHTKSWEKYYNTSKLSSKIKILPRQSNQQEIASIINQADVGVFLSRAEGFNLPLIESLACGKQVITTNYSAHTEYCNELNSNLVSISELETAYDGLYFNGTGKWAKLGENQLEQTIEHMRQVHKNKQVNKEGLLTAKKFEWSNTSTNLINIITDKLND